MGSRTPWGGGVRLQDFGPRGGFDCRVFGFSGAKRPKRRRRRRFRKFWRFFENFTKLMYSKSTKIAFQWHFGRTHFCVRTLKKSQIFARTFKINISASGRKTPLNPIFSCFIAFLCIIGPIVDLFSTKFSVRTLKCWFLTFGRKFEIFFNVQTQKWVRPKCHWNAILELLSTSI